ncbi:hypothetical protein MMC22_002017 [Lobaria immixta]|nr:hypothetical protein [Lobaria immixta]
MNWFRSNDIDTHVSQKTRTEDAAIDDPANALLLREDLHRAFDKLQFVFISKANGVLVTHVLESTIELRNLYHNSSLHQGGHADVEHIEELKEAAAGGSRRKKTQDSRSDDGLINTANQANDFRTLVQQRQKFGRARSDPEG